MYFVYIGVNFFHTPTEYKKMMSHLKQEIGKWRCYPIVGEILIPITGDIAHTTWYRGEHQKSFLQKGNVVLVDTTHGPRVHQQFKSILSNHKVLLIECRKTEKPRSRSELNPPPTREYVLMLEYKESIMEVYDYILTKACLYNSTHQS